MITDSLAQLRDILAVHIPHDEDVCVGLHLCSDCESYFTEREVQ